MAKMRSFGCEFVEQPPAYLQSECPICLLILRDPYQVTCCGKSVCEACIQEIKGRNQPCPTCMKENFDHFPNLGLKQPLYGFKVYCCNKAKGCDWQGELGQLDQHLNLNPDEDKQLINRCAFAQIKCFFCDDVYERYQLEKHQQSECLERPFTCSMCEAYESTYYDVTNHHAPVCEFRPVECPNSCGDNLQHRHLEEHLSRQCPLSLVECEFSHAGCDVEVCRKDLPTHCMVTHMSLLARDLKLQVEENKLKLKKQAEDSELQLKKLAEYNELQLKKQAEDSELQLKKQAEDSELQLKEQAENNELQLKKLAEDIQLQLKLQLEKQLEKQAEDSEKLKQQIERQFQKQDEDIQLQLKKQDELLLKSEKPQLKEQLAHEQKIFLRLLNGIPPLDILISMKSSIKSHVIYSRSGYKLEADLWCNSEVFGYSFFTVESEFDVQSPCKLSITALLVDQVENNDHLKLKYDIDHPCIKCCYTSTYGRKARSITCSYNQVHLKDGSLILRITDIRNL